MTSHAPEDQDLRSPRADVDETTVLSVAQGAASECEPDLTIDSDITSDFPIGPAELEAIETYFGHLLDLVLTGNKTSAATLPRRTG